MSSEQFDKRIKAKLEQVKPPYPEQAWKNFQSLLPAPWYVTWYKTYSGWLYSSIGTLAIVATSYLYFQEKKENKQLHEEITTLQSQINNQNNNPRALPEKLPTDTLPEIRPVVPERQVLPEVPEKLVTEKKIPTRSNSAKVGKQLNVSSPGAMNPAERAAEPVNPVATLLRDSSAIVDKKSPRDGQNSGQSGEVPPTNLPATSPAFTDRRQSPASNSTTPANQETKQPIPVPPANIPVAADSLADSTQVVVATKAEAGEKPLMDAATVQFRVGLHTNVKGFEKATIGPVAEIIFKNRLSLNTGLLFGTPEEKRLPLPRDYNRVTGRRFEEDYRKHIPHNDRLQSIVVKTSVIRMPVGLNYYFPVKGNFSVLAEVGSRLNLSSYQTVEFRSFFGGDEQLNKFEIKYKTSTFNNLYFGLGVQYRFGRLVGQVAPYLDMYFREPDYFNQSKKFGVNAALKFDLKK